MIRIGARDKPLIGSLGEVTSVRVSLPSILEPRDYTQDPCCPGLGWADIIFNSTFLSFVPRYQAGHHDLFSSQDVEPNCKIAIFVDGEMSSATPSPIPSFPVSSMSFNNLSVIGVVFSALSALFGAYVILFGLAIWSTYRRSGTAYRRLRIITVVLFINLLIHYICRGITFGKARLIKPPEDEARMVMIPIVFIGAITCTFAGFLSDSLVAWRFYVVYGKKKWALYMPATAIVVNALLGFSGDFQHLSFYHSTWLYTVTFKLDAFKINAAWGWFTFGINTILSGAIIGKIIYISRSTSKQNAAKPYGGSRYNTALAAVTESAFVTWIGLLLYEIASLAPTGHITSAWNVGYVMICIIPIFFGISQCLIVARLGLANDVFDRQSKYVIGVPLGGETQHGTNEIAITVSRETVIDVEKGTLTNEGTQA